MKIIYQITFCLLSITFSNNIAAQAIEIPPLKVEPDIDLVINICSEDSLEELKTKIKAVELFTTTGKIEYEFKDNKIVSLSYVSELGSCKSDDFEFLTLQIKDKKTFSCGIK